jgi:hypothetical protein
MSVLDGRAAPGARSAPAFFEIDFQNASLLACYLWPSSFASVVPQARPPVVSMV